MRPPPSSLEWLSFRPSAAAHREPLVLLHEGLGAASHWRDVPQRLADETGRETSVFSRWGYGGSPARPAPWPARFLEEEAEALPALLDARGVRRAVLYGHSDGASIALVAAALVPERVSALVLEAPHLFVEAMTLAEISSFQRDYEGSKAQESLRRRHGEKADALVAAWTEVWLSERFRSLELAPWMSRVRCPVLVLQGSADPYGTWKQVEEVERCAPQTRSRRFEGAGHSVHRDAAEEVLAEVAAFLSPRDGTGEPR